MESSIPRHRQFRLTPLQEPCRLEFHKRLLFILQIICPQTTCRLILAVRKGVVTSLMDKLRAVREAGLMFKSHFPPQVRIQFKLMLPTERIPRIGAEPISLERQALQPSPSLDLR